jgi:D-alanyl-D-alanine carboxypeptidase
MSPQTEDVPEAYAGRPPKFAEARELRSVGLDVHGRDALLHPLAAEAWINMAREAALDGKTLLIVSAFRSIDRQRQIVYRKRACGMSWDQILRVSAYPGFSEHHTGCALDIGSPISCDLSENFEETGEFRWLTENAAKFGFSMSYPRNNSSGVIYEPWHWMWMPIGLDLAR